LLERSLLQKGSQQEQPQLVSSLSSAIPRLIRSFLSLAEFCKRVIAALKMMHVSGHKSVDTL
jgi:hypothetical protein